MCLCVIACPCVHLCAYIRVSIVWGQILLPQLAKLPSKQLQHRMPEVTNDRSLFAIFKEIESVDIQTKHDAVKDPFMIGFVHYSYLYIVSNIYIYIRINNFQLSCSTYTKKMNRHTVTSLLRSFYIHLSRVSGVCSFPILLATWRASSAAWTPCNGWGNGAKLLDGIYGIYPTTKIDMSTKKAPVYKKISCSSSNHWFSGDVSVFGRVYPLANIPL